MNINLDDVTKRGFNVKNIKDYLELCFKYGADDFVLPLQEELNDQDFTDSPEIAGNDYSGAVREYYFDTQESRYKLVYNIKLSYSYESTGLDVNKFANMTALTNGFSIYIDRVFEINGSPQIVRLFSFPVIKTNSDVIDRFKDRFYETEEKVGAATATFVTAVFDFYDTPYRIRNLIDVGGTDPVSDRIGVVLNDNFNVATSALRSFQIQVNGKSIFLSGSVLG